MSGIDAGPAVVALGGGHGLATSLSALRRVTGRLTAVVTVADDGGSSGRLRREFGCLPPGDLRMALAALCGDDEWGQLWTRVSQHRFRSGPGTTWGIEGTEGLDGTEGTERRDGTEHTEGGDGREPADALGGHAVGNLLILALWQLLGDTVEGLDHVGQLLGARGRVLPMSLEPISIEAEVVLPGSIELTRLFGQVAVASSAGRLVAVELVPRNPRACPEAVQAVRDADLLVLGPGSWFTSVIPHLLVPELREAITCSPARRAVALNLAPQPGETDGFSPEQHLEALAAHAPELALDYVLADPRSVPDAARLASVAKTFGAELVLAPVGRADGSPQHDPHALALAYGALLEGGRIAPWQ